MSFSAHGIGMVSGRVSSAQFAALLLSVIWLGVTLVRRPPSEAAA